MSPQTKISIDELDDMTTGELRERYHEVFGEPTRSRNKVFLKKRIAWRMQALDEGDLSERARSRALEIANDADLRIKPPGRVSTTTPPDHTIMGKIEASRDDRLPLPGTLLKRKYKGRIIRALVLADGFEYGGKIYQSLSAIATEVAGTRWNGYNFFGLVRKGDSNE